MSHFQIGDAIECFLTDDPDFPPQDGVVKEVDGPHVYVVGESYGRWIDTTPESVVAIRLKENA